jgi:ABC-2 type transport system permease protein
MSKIFTIAKWEYLEKIKTRAFIISLIITPGIIILFSILPTILSEHEENTPKAFGIVDTSEIYYPRMIEILDNYKLKSGQPNYVFINLTFSDESLADLKRSSDEKVLSAYLEGYLFVSNGGTDSTSVEFRSKNIGNTRDMNRIEHAFNEARIRFELEKYGVSEEIKSGITKDIEFASIKIDEEGKESKSDFVIVFLSSFVFIMLLMMMILYSGGMLIRSLVEEKSNRLIEILISSTTADELLAGKILGLSLLGLTQLLLWALIGTTLAGSAIIPFQAFTNILPMLFYFLLGFVFYTAIFVGIGSVVTTEQEAQQITSYISLILILPIVFSITAIQNPDTLIIKILSYFPLTTPSIMMLRLNISKISSWEFILTSLILIISIYLTISFSAKVFRVGILSYGKRPSLKEFFSWVKEK